MTTNTCYLALWMTLESIFWCESLLAVVTTTTITYLNVLWYIPKSLHTDEWFTTGNVLKMEMQLLMWPQVAKCLSTNIFMWRACSFVQSTCLTSMLSRAFSGKPECWEVCFRTSAAEDDLSDYFETQTNVFLLLFARRDTCIQRRVVISRMFPVAESAFIITAEEILPDRVHP